MILNITDRRKRKDRWKCINAVIEDTWHDNKHDDADQASRDLEREMPYDERTGISLSAAIEWAMASKSDVTLFFYDKGKGIE